jgi:hypothetical protein
MRYSITSRSLRRTFTFWANDKGGYVYLESEGRIGTTGQQISDTNGNTLSCAGDLASLRRVASRWYRRQRLASRYCDL